MRNYNLYFFYLYENINNENALGFLTTNNKLTTGIDLMIFVNIKSFRRSTDFILVYQFCFTEATRPYQDV